LGFARGGKYEVIPTDFNQLLKNTAEMFGRTKKEIRIISKLNPQLWTVEVGGPHRLDSLTGRISYKSKAFEKRKRHQAASANG
jgi:hypothetical protein